MKLLEDPKIKLDVTEDEYFRLVEESNKGGDIFFVEDMGSCAHPSNDVTIHFYKDSPESMSKFIEILQRLKSRG